MKCELALPQYPLLLSLQASLATFLSLILNIPSSLIFYNTAILNYGDLHMAGCENSSDEMNVWVGTCSQNMYIRQLVT